MILMLRKFIPLLLLLLFSCEPKHEKDDILLWYTTPACTSVTDKPLIWKYDTEWMKALPLGNGSLGGMVYGGVNLDRIQLSEETMWSGSYQESDNPKAKQHLATIRQLLFDGKYKAATDLCSSTQICKGVGTGRAHGAAIPYGSFQMLGDLWLDFDDKSSYSNYKRQLNLNKAVAQVSYTQGGVNFVREYLTSFPDQVMALRLTADKENKISFTAKMNRAERYKTYSEGENLIMRGALADGKGGDGLHYMTRLKAITKGGTVSYSDSTVSIKSATEVVLLLAASTDYVLDYPRYTGRDYEALTKQRIDNAAALGYSRLHETHVRDYASLFDRSDFSLSNSSVNKIPTDSLLVRVKNNHQVDTRLHELLFHFGKYLLISSSRPGTLPANLQGIWTNKLNSPWNGDFHTDINIQMNYWPTEVTNLSELHQPLFDLINSIVEPGTKTAQVQYGMKGWVVHPVTNVWGFTSPGERIGWGMHAGATAWICQHIAEHYRFTGDSDFLKEMYPALKGAVMFYLDWLVKDPKTGEYISGPAVSPENTFYAPDGSKCQISMGPSHDQQVIYQLLSDFIAASDVLQENDTIVEHVKQVLVHLAQSPIGPDGRLMEWRYDFKEVDKGHRHLSHMFALHPGCQINTVQTPELVEAAKKSLQCRIAHGTGHVGWSGAWLVNLYARLQDSEHAIDGINTMLETHIAPNMFSLLGAPFQIEAGFGLTAGIAEMLLQSHVYDQGVQVLSILPTLPSVWKTGCFKRLKARGGFEISASWEDGKLNELKVLSLLGNKCRIIYDGQELFNGKLEQGTSWEYK